MFLILQDLQIYKKKPFSSQNFFDKKFHNTKFYLNLIEKICNSWGFLFIFSITTITINSIMPMTILTITTLNLTISMPILTMAMLILTIPISSLTTTFLILTILAFFVKIRQFVNLITSSIKANKFAL